MRFPFFSSLNVHISIDNGNFKLCMHDGNIHVVEGTVFQIFVLGLSFNSTSKTGNIGNFDVQNGKQFG